MEEKIVKYYSDLFQQEVNLIIDEKLNLIDAKKIVSPKLAEVNEELKNIELPQIG